MKGPRLPHPSQAQGGALDGAVNELSHGEAFLALTASWRQSLGEPESFLRYLS
jgi:hypothetical protein